MDVICNESLKIIRILLQYKLVVFTGTRVEPVSDSDGVDGDKCVDIQRFKNTPCKYRLLD